LGSLGCTSVAAMRPHLQGGRNEVFKDFDVVRVRRPDRLKRHCRAANSHNQARRRTVGSYRQEGGLEGVLGPSHRQGSAWQGAQEIPLCMQEEWRQGSLTAKMQYSNTIHNPEFIAFARAVFDEVCAALPPERNTQSTRALLAECILKAADAGERDPARLRAHALRSIDEVA
jgi:hypothetical protein